MLRESQQLINDIEINYNHKISQPYITTRKHLNLYSKKKKKQSKKGHLRIPTLNFTQRLQEHHLISSRPFKNTNIRFHPELSRTSTLNFIQTL